MTDRKKSLALTFASLGMVFGDIGTSPLYAMHVTLYGLAITTANILGVLSLIIWSLIVIISIKYLAVFFRADNEGEGGILALYALIKQKRAKFQPFFYFLAIFGTGLLLGDGMLMPATSVMSAMEGLKMVSPIFGDYTQIISCLILFVLFAFQYKGPGKIAYAFGPIIFIWLITIAYLGLIPLSHHPMVLKAFNPYYAFEFLHLNGRHGFYLLGGVFLVVTGGEALYANIGGFGKNHIRRSWFMVVLPSLLLNYLGQGANLLLHPEAAINPFYSLSSDGFYMFLVALATLASIIASQSIILAIFSLTKQAILLGLCPRISIVQTSKEQIGQIYIRQMNFLLLIGTLFSIYFFKNSSGLAHAYGVAVNVYMLLVTILVAYAARVVWQWSIPDVFAIFTLFMTIDLAFLGANVHKIVNGGWIPIGFAIVIALIMHTWREGLNYIQRIFYDEKENLSDIVSRLQKESINQLTGLTGIFITDIYDRSGSSFLNFLKLHMAIPEHILIVNYRIENKPYVHLKKRFELHLLNQNLLQLTLHYGFMETISLPHALNVLNEKKMLPFQIKVEQATYFVEIPNIMASKKKKTLTFYWQERVFAFLMRNYASNLNISFYNIPYNRTIAIGTSCII
jgi:KUP system potassium uptake protein